MNARLRALVRNRAGDRCEYCRLPQAALRSALQIEHIVAQQHQGKGVQENLALACDRCNLHKGSNLSAIDPDTGQLVRLFNPRLDEWDRHFILWGYRIIGRTSIGRATVWLLQFNAKRRLELRSTLIDTGQW